MTHEQQDSLVSVEETRRVEQFLLREARLLDDAQARGKVGAAGRARVEEFYSWAAVAAKTAAHYETVLARTGAGVKGKDQC